MPLTKCLAMDCEMVGTGPKGKYAMLGRVSIVDEYCDCVYDEYVLPTAPVTTYRTWVSGIKPGDLDDGLDFEDVRDTVRRMIRRRVVVGHALDHDLNVLELFKPDHMLRDTSSYPPFRRMYGNRTPSLRWLYHRLFGREIQKGAHCSVEDAAAAMKIYKHVKPQWERYVLNTYYDSDSD